MSNAIHPNDPPVVPVETSTKQERIRHWVTGWRLGGDLLLVIGWIAVTDWLLYQLGTFFSWGLLLMGVVVLFAVLKRSTCRLGPSIAIAILLVAMATKLIWCGSWLQVACGILLILCYAMSTSGAVPFLPELLGFCLLMFSGAARRVSRFRLRNFSTAAGAAQPLFGASVMLPAVMLGAFSSLFVLANPDLATDVMAQLNIAMNSMANLFQGLEPLQVVFWFASGWFVLGLLYPSMMRLLPESAPLESRMVEESGMFSAYRNTLLSLIALFAVYLAFEFKTLWFRTLPEDFYYAGYAHEGAFWLTVALALATVVLSFIFRGRTLSDPRLTRLKGLACVWAVLNLLLSLAVYNRLFIYIDFNGMTRMRVVGLLGITAVVAGFALVVVKLWRNHGFIWLLHRQLWVPVTAIVLYALLPVDWVIQRHNVAHVLGGNPAPVVQIISHRTSAEGILPVLALANADEPTIRRGVRALLALWAQELRVAGSRPGAGGGPAGEGSPDSVQPRRSEFGHATPWLGLPTGFAVQRGGSEGQAAWYEFQISETLLTRQLVESEEKWSEFAQSPAARDQALDDFFKFAYRWY